MKTKVKHTLGVLRRISTAWLALVLSCAALTACSQTASSAHEIPDAVVKWALETPDDLVTLRIPGGYRSLGGVVMKTILGPGYPSPQGGYETYLSIETLWPDLPPRTKKNAQEYMALGGGRLLLISVAAYARAPLERRSKLLEIHFQSLRDANQLGGRYLMMPLQAKFGLQREGIDLATHGERLNDSTPVDFYFQRDPQGQMQVFIRCTAEAIRDQEDDPSSHYSPQCSQYFNYPPLNAEVEVNYRRKYLKNWREIQTKTEQLLQSFIQSK